MSRLRKIILDNKEAAVLAALVSSLKGKYVSVDDPEFIKNICVYVEQIPENLRIQLKKFKGQADDTVLQISGFYEFIQEPVAPTPSHWREVTEPNSVYDYYFVLISSALGDVFGFSNLQDGKLVQEIFPIISDAEKQLGTGSVELYLHTEDSSLDYRADYLGFMCKRNIDMIPTNVAIPDFSRLSSDAKDILRQKKFKIFNDRPCFSIEQKEPPSVITSVLYGREGAECMRYDPLYTDNLSLNEMQKNALNELIKLVDASITPVLLKQGELAFIDNRRCAHGRSEFIPRYDGTDRWLKRTQISTRLDHFVDLLVNDSGRLLP